MNPREVAKREERAFRQGYIVGVVVTTALGAFFFYWWPL